MQKSHQVLFTLIPMLAVSLFLTGCSSGFVWFVIIVIVAIWIIKKAVKSQKKVSRPVVASKKRIAQHNDDSDDNDTEVRFIVTTSWDQRASAKAGTWTMSDQPLNIHGHTLPNPMFYVGVFSKDSILDPSTINKSLPVAKRASANTQDLGYWPSYSQMTAGQRRRYLDWLSTGRQSLDIDTGYVFVFYYGLERRLLVDKEDQREIIAEVRRLRSIYDNRSFQRYSADLLTFVGSFNFDKIEESDLEQVFPPSYGEYGYSEETLATALTWFFLKQQPLSWKWALVAAQNDPRSPSSVITTRVRTEFEQLFKKRYEERCGEGIVLKISKRKKTLDYRPASEALLVLSRYGENTASEFSRSLPNPLGIPTQFKPLVEIWTQCIEDLKSYSRKQSKMQDGEPLTAEAWEQLPPELRAEYDHPESSKWSEVIGKHIQDDTVAFVPTKEIAALKQIPVRDRLTVGQSVKIVETGTSLGYAIEPDARMTRRGYGWGENLAIYHEQSPDEHLEATSQYGPASIMLQLAMAIAAADGVVAPEELETITHFFDNRFDLSASCRKRLSALGNYFIQSEISLSGIGKRIQAHLDDNLRHKLGKFLVAVAAADGVIDKSEVQVLKKAYKAMGMEPNDAVTEVNAIELPPAEEPVVVQQATQEKAGEQIPAPPSADTTEAIPVKLDRNAIANILEDTREVAQLLGSVLSDDDDESTPANEQQPSPHGSASMSATAQASTPPQGPNTPKPSSPFDILDARHKSFVSEIIQRDEWSELDFRQIAGRHDLMPNGAIETVNEWSDDIFGDFLIEGNGPFTINRNLLSD